MAVSFFCLNKKTDYFLAATEEILLKLNTLSVNEINH